MPENTTEELQENTTAELTAEEKEAKREAERDLVRNASQKKLERAKKKAIRRCIISVVALILGIVGVIHTNRALTRYNEEFPSTETAEQTTEAPESETN